MLTLTKEPNKQFLHKQTEVSSASTSNTYQEQVKSVYLDRSNSEQEQTTLYLSQGIAVLLVSLR